MNTKFKLEVEMNEADYQAIVAITRRRRSTMSNAINALIAVALEKVDPREYEPSQNDALPIFTEELTDEFAVIPDLIADKF